MPIQSPRRSGRARVGAAAVLVLTAATLPALTAPGAAAQAPRGASVHITKSQVRLAVPASRTAPGYRLRIDRSPFRVVTKRAGRTVLATGTGTASGPATFHTAKGDATATKVTGIAWSKGVLDLTLKTSLAGATVDYRITPKRDRYQVSWTVDGAKADKVTTHYDAASAGHWYGHGEAQTPDGGPYTRQPWPLDSGTVADDAMGPAEYLMTDPFWFTQRGTGLWVDTTNVMNVSINNDTKGVVGAGITDSDTFTGTVFVERTARAVYEDYIGIAGTPDKSDATRKQYAKPLFNTWAQNYTSVSQKSVLDYATGLHTAGVPTHTIQVDDGWSTHYGDFDFNSKFPDPKALSKAVHDMGYDFGLWVTLWINNDAKNYQYAVDHGYLLKSKDDPSKACSVEWWNGTAGVVDIANPAARTWYEGKLHDLEKTYGVDGFKFDTRFFDESCQPYPGHTALDYIKLGASLTDEFDQQGAGVRISWTGSQKYGFVTREIDKGTDWNSLQAAVSQTMAISTIGYPFVETDMIGGSESEPPPSKQVLVRWAQAASLMPLMYSSTSPLGVDSPAGKQDYDAQTVALYKKAVKLHQSLAPYIDKQVKRAVRTGEPIMKPLFFDFPNDTASYTVDDEWLLGDDILAAPIVDEGTSRSVHLPAGLWFDVAHQRVVRGGTIANYRASLSQTPMFVRLGRAGSAALVRAATR